MTDLFEHQITLVSRTHFNRYRSCKVTQYRHVCTCRWTSTWRETLDKSIIDRDKHAISGQLSIPL